MAIADLFRDAKFKLFGKPFSQGDKSPSLEVDVWKGNVGITVYTNSERDSNPEKRIKAPMSFRILNGFMETLRGYIGIGIMAGKLPNTTIIENFTSNKDENGERTEGKQLISTTHLGFNPDGTIFISVRDADASRPQINFTFGGDNWHKYTNGDTGQPLDPVQVSRLDAYSWLQSLLEIIPPAMVAIAEAAGDTKAPAAGGNGGGGGGYNNGGGGGFKKPWQGNNNGGGGNGGGGGFKKPWQGNNNGGGGGFKKPWQGNNSGGGGNSYGGGGNGESG